MFDALKADLKRALDLSFDTLTTPERLVMLEHCEKIRRILPAVEHPLINQIREQTDRRGRRSRRAQGRYRRAAAAAAGGHRRRATQR